MKHEPPIADLGARLAEALGAHAPAATHPLLAQSLRVLWREREQGHVCLPLPAWAGRVADGESEPFPGLAAWRSGLTATGLCADGRADEPASPLVLDSGDRLYLRRDFVAERTIARCLQQRLAEPERMPAATVRAHLQALRLLPPEGTVPDPQLLATIAAARSSFLVLTGGPGTGKTTTVARMLALLLRAEPHLRIALCAPTGKAAARLLEALRQRAAAEPEVAVVAERCQPVTLHRLLGYLPVDDSFRVGPQQPLRHDVVVVDEASMADPVLLAVLCRAMPPQARLVLVGDKDQLAAVAAGQVLGDVCRAAAPERGVGKRLAAFVQAVTGSAPPTNPAAPAIADHTVHLQHSHRFGTRPGIGGFATALARRDVRTALAVLAEGHADLQAPGTVDHALQAIEAAVLRVVRGAATDVAQRLAALRVLTATRHGPGGAIAWNARIEQLLQRHGVRVQDPWYEGRPILVTANDHQNHVYNGDLGLVVRDGDGRLVVAFPRGDGRLRHVARQRLPAHETAWAMTVHKAQGSEFDDVLVVMPERDGPLWQASLVYTAITRARQRAWLLADPTLLAAALTRWPERSSGLADALRS
ncbi:MAG: exodeoxyribonuclease V subunit alpha [Planctomycetes bacterium]|nr:exodeoxyribonuclease V subunit alpha [Planctomycetota bacterium]